MKEILKEQVEVAVEIEAEVIISTSTLF